MDKLTYTSTCALEAHTRGLAKPNEDLAFIDHENGILMILDGITRVHSEYDERPYQSAACEVNHIFSNAVYEHLMENLRETDTKKLLSDAVLYGNGKIYEYRSSKSAAEWGFYPGTLGIVGMIRCNQFHYVCTGDCLGMIIRGNAKIVFGNQPAVHAVDLHQVSKQERYSVYCNHPENHLSYGVFNGDPSVAEMIEYSFIDLCHNDTVFLATDGISKYIKYEKSAILVAKSVEEMMEASKEYDAPPYSSYGDDKGIIKIKIS